MAQTQKEEGPGCSFESPAAAGTGSFLTPGMLCFLTLELFFVLKMLVVLVVVSFDTASRVELSGVNTRKAVENGINLSRVNIKKHLKMKNLVCCLQEGLPWWFRW